MRPPAVEKCGFYPTPLSVLEIIKSFITPTAGRLLDPCCGEGVAANTIAKHLGMLSYGVEMAPTRAAVAATVLNFVEYSTWEDVKAQIEAFSVLWLNPPYEDNRETGRRFEEDFLKSSTPNLMRGGLLVYIVPQHILMQPGVATTIVGYYDQVKVFRFPEDEFPRYKQIVLFGIRRENYIHPTREMTQVIAAMGNPANPLTNLAAVTEPIYMPVKGDVSRPITFYRRQHDPQEILDIARKEGIHRQGIFMDFTLPKGNRLVFENPVMPMKIGHVSWAISSGIMGNVPIADSYGDMTYVRGRVEKTIRTIDTKEKEGDSTKQLVTRQETFSTTIATTKQTGITVIDGKNITGLTEFLTENGEKIGRHIFTTYRPLYNFDPTDEENNILDGLSLSRKTLPGQERPGLLPAQRDAAIAGLRSLLNTGVVIIQAEMGTGKTTMASAILALLKSDKGFPGLVLCPPHLIEKWKRELMEVIPGCQVREIAMVQEKVEHDKTGDHLVGYNDVERFLKDAESGLLGRYPMAIVANSTVKLASSFEPAVIFRKVRGKKGFTSVACCPKCGQPIKFINGREEFYAFSWDQIPLKQKYYCQNRVDGWILDEDGNCKRDPVTGQRTWEKGDAKAKTGRICGEPLFTVSTFRRQQEKEGTKYIVDDRASRRVMISEWILKHAKGRFKSLIADEVHEYKAEAADRAISFQQIARSVNYVICLTGTLFGGNSTSLFFLLHRLNKGVRSDYRFEDKNRWAQRYGIYQWVETQLKRKTYGDTGNERENTTLKEKPGVSPEIINRLLGNTIFMSLKDLGVHLPSYNEELVTIKMSDKQAAQYSNMESELDDMAKKDRRLLSTWLQWCLARPNSAFRDEVVEVPVVDEDEERRTGKKHKSAAKCNEDEKVQLMELPAVVKGSPIIVNGALENVLPKEAWLTTYVATEKLEGRKCLIFIRCTGDRDIQPRVQEVLKVAGLKARILPSAVNPRKREQWINDNTGDIDALICNANLVKTGLDLVMFQTVLFYEIEYSLYTLWQAVRRVWRLGQVKPVKAVFCVYEDTMEMNALKLMGMKMKAAQVMYGDVVQGAIIETDETDQLNMLTRDLLDGKSGLGDLQSLFAENSKVSHSATGSFTLPSAPLVVPPPSKVQPPMTLTWDDWRKRLKEEQVKKTQLKKPSEGKKSIPEVKKPNKPANNRPQQGSLF